MPTSENFDDTEYHTSNSANASHAIVAWQNGSSGKGVKIGFVDSGLNPNNPDFAGKIDPASQDVAGSRPMSDEYGHGTATASIAAAARNNFGMEGIAYDSMIIMMKADEPGSCDGGCDYSSSDIAQGIRLATDAGARVINISLSGDTSSKILDAVRYAASHGVIIVIPAANDSASQPSSFARDIAAAAPGQVIIVGALGRDLGSTIDYNQLVTYSNAAGSFQNWYIGAPGYLINVAYLAGQSGLDKVSGTSFASPAVAGAVALLVQAFPNLTPEEVVQILLTTGDDIGASGIDTVFGHGRLNIGRAFQPIGQTSLAGSAMVVSQIPTGSAPAAAGDALERGSLRAVILDAYARAFTMNLARTIRSSAPARTLERALIGNVRSSSFTMSTFGVGLTAYQPSFDKRLGFAVPNVGPTFADDTKLQDISISTRLPLESALAFSSSGSVDALERSLAGARPRNFMLNDDQAVSSGFSVRSDGAFALQRKIGSLSLVTSHESGDVLKAFIDEEPANYRLTRAALFDRVGDALMSIGLTKLSESKTVLGGRLGKVFGESGAKTTLVDASFERLLGRRLFVAANARRGWTKFSAGSFKTSAYSVRLTMASFNRWGDELTLLVAQPLRVERGGLAMLLPGAYDYASSTPRYDRQFLSLSPSGREVIAEIGYSRKLPSGRVGVNMYARRDPGHRASAPADVGALLQFQMKL